MIFINYSPLSTERGEKNPIVHNISQKNPKRKQEKKPKKIMKREEEETG
jgi:hypothetical protein